LGDLQRMELLYEPPADAEPTYTFKHVLTQEVAYNTLSQERKRPLHERAAQAIEGLAGERLAEHYGELAHHYSRSDNTQKAVIYLQQAGQQAADRSACREAITHLTRGLELLPSFPESPERNRQELDLQITLAQALSVIKGQTALEVEHAYIRARVLCEQLGETPQLLVVLGGLRTMYEVRGELLKARELAEQLLSLAQREPDPARLMQANISVGTPLFQLGEFAPARAYLDQAMPLDDPTQDRAATVRLSNQIQGASCRRYAAWTLWYLGYPNQALQRNQEAIALTQELEHPYSLAYALHHAAVLHRLHREAQAAQGQAEALIALARQQECPGMVARRIFSRGWALAAQGQEMEGIAQMRQGMDAQRLMGVEVQPPHRLALLAEAYGRIGRTAEARRLLAEGLVSNTQTWGDYHEAEVYRLTGELRLMQDAGGGVSGSPPPDLSMTDGHEGEAPSQSPRRSEAATRFRRALGAARRQQAKSLELRAAMGLSRLGQQQGRRTDAYQLLASIYRWFTEGFDTDDLQDAKALLEAMACRG
jgi:predicted ATPase